MPLGRITRFSRVPRGARRINVMRLGAGSVKALAPSLALLRDFQRAKKALLAAGRDLASAHIGAFRQVRYRVRYLRQLRADTRARRALRDLLACARHENLYLMCMCPARTPGRACHTYLVLDHARKALPPVRILPEPT